MMRGWVEEVKLRPGPHGCRYVCACVCLYRYIYISICRFTNIAFSVQCDCLSTHINRVLGRFNLSVWTTPFRVKVFRKLCFTFLLHVHRNTFVQYSEVTQLRCQSTHKNEPSLGCTIVVVVISLEVRS